MFFWIIKDGVLMPTDELSDFMFQEGWRFSHYDKQILPFNVDETKTHFRNLQYGF